MYRRLGSLTSLTALAVAALLVTAGSGRAQVYGSLGGYAPYGAGTGLRTPNYYGYSPTGVLLPNNGWGYNTGTYGYTGVPLGSIERYPPIFMTSINYPGVYGSYTYGIAASGFNVAPSLGSSLYPPVAPGATISTTTPLNDPTDRTAEVDVRLPADATLWFEGVKTSQTGSYRTFVSPPLTSGRDFAYDVRASWTENGREVNQNRRVRIRAGDRVEIDFLRDRPTESTTLRTTTLP